MLLLVCTECVRTTVVLKVDRTLSHRRRTTEMLFRVLFLIVAAANGLTVDNALLPTRSSRLCRKPATRMALLDDMGKVRATR